MASDLLPSAPLLTDEYDNDTNYPNNNMSPTPNLSMAETKHSIQYNIENINHNTMNMTLTDNGQRIQPFSENQLMGLLLQETHLQKFQDIDRFIDQFLMEMQSIDLANCAMTCDNQILAQQNALMQLLNTYMNARKGLSKARTSIDVRLSEAHILEEQLWAFVSKVSQMKGHCHDDKELSSSYEYKMAEFNSSAAASLRQAHKDIKTLIMDDHALHNFKATSARVSIEQRLQPLLGNNCDPDLPNKEVLKRSISVLFNFQRTKRLQTTSSNAELLNCDMNDPIFVEDSRHWLEQTTIALFDHPKCTFEDKLFILHHILKCGPGFGRWAARLFQPDPPIIEADKNEYLSCNPVHCQTEAKDGMEAIHHILIMISTILTPIRDRENLIREAFPNLAASQNRNTLSPTKRTSSPKINQNDKVSSGPKDLWVVVDSEGEDDDENDENFRENDLVSLLNQVPLDSVFRYMLKIKIQDAKPW